jgi:hypothetical protein
MKKHISKNTVCVLALMMGSILAVFACVEYSHQSPEDVVKKYWEYCLNKNFEDAQNLVCTEGFLNCWNRPIDPNQGVAMSNSTKDTNKESNVSDNKKDILRDMNSCCFSEMIATDKVKVVNTTELRKTADFVEIITEIEDLKQNKGKYLNCLVKDLSKNQWKIHKIERIFPEFDYKNTKASFCGTTFWETTDQEKTENKNSQK